MEPKKRGRPSQGKVWKSFTADKEVADFLDSLPDGERSRFVNDALARGIAELQGTSELEARKDEIEWRMPIPIMPGDDDYAQGYNDHAKHMEQHREKRLAFLDAISASRKGE